MDEYDQRTLKAYQDKVGFLKDLENLFDKYKVTNFQVYEDSSNWETYVKSIDVEFDADYNNRNWLDISFSGRVIYLEDVQEKLSDAEIELNNFESSFKTQ